MVNLSEGIAVDAAHSMKNRKTEFQGVDLATGEILFYRDLGNKTINIGEFLAVVEACKYIVDHDFKPRRIFTDSTTAIAWFNAKRAQSKKRDKQLDIALIYLRAAHEYIDDIEVLHWDNKLYGETPADFGNK